MGRLGERVAILANLGVFLGFLAVAWQLQLTRDALEASANQTNNQLFLAADQGLVGDDAAEAFARSMIAPAEMSDAQVAQLWSYMSTVYFSAYQAYEEHRQGRMSEARWFVTRDVFISYFNYPAGLVWWQTTKSGYGDPTMTAFFRDVDERLAEVPVHQAQQAYLVMIEQFRGLPSVTPPEPADPPSGAAAEPGP